MQGVMAPWRKAFVKKIGETVSGFNKKHEVFLSNWTEWSTIQGLFARIISKMDEREARGRFEITRATTWIVWHEV